MSQVLVIFQMSIRVRVERDLKSKVAEEVTGHRVGEGEKELEDEEKDAGKELEEEERDTGKELEEEETEAGEELEEEEDVHTSFVVDDLERKIRESFQLAERRAKGVRPTRAGSTSVLAPDLKVIVEILIF